MIKLLIKLLMLNKIRIIDDINNQFIDFKVQMWASSI